MEVEGEGAPTSQKAISCAKAALVLSSLKSLPNRRRNAAAATTNRHDVTVEEEEEAVKREMRDLKMEVVKERLKSKSLKLSGLVELSLELLLLSALAAFFFTFAFPN